MTPLDVLYQVQQDDHIYQAGFARQTIPAVISRAEVRGCLRMTPTPAVAVYTKNAVELGDFVHERVAVTLRRRLPCMFCFLSSFSEVPSARGVIQQKSDWKYFLSQCRCPR